MSARNLKAIQKLKRRAMDPRNKSGGGGRREPHGVSRAEHRPRHRYVSRAPARPLRCSADELDRRDRQNQGHDDNRRRPAQVLIHKRLGLGVLQQGRL